MELITPDEMRGWSSQKYAQMSLWAKANNIDPLNISVKHPLSVEYIDAMYVIRYYRLTRDKQGRVLRDEKTNEVCATVQLVPLVVPLP